MPDIIFKLTELQEVFFFFKAYYFTESCIWIILYCEFFFNWINPVS